LQINVTWVEILLPYVGKADPAEVGKIIQALLPALKDVRALHWIGFGGFLVGG
jgi:hypothetical protein